MKDRDIHIEQLMMERLSGIIDKADFSYLDDLIKNDAGISDKWERLKNDFNRTGSQRYLESLDAGNALSRLRPNISQKKQQNRALSYGLKIAASVMIPLILAATFYFHKKTPAPVAVADLQVPERSVKLYAGGGRVLSLSQNTPANDTANVKNVKLNIGNGSLSYVPVTDQADNTLNTLVIPETLTYKLTLSDGTDVWLNSESQLKFPFTFSIDKREVWVSGEAYFKVTKNASRPFIVHTPLYDIQVLGTEFNVNTYDSLHGATALVTGSVKTHTVNGPGILLKPGYQAVFAGGNTFQLKTFDNYNELSWMSGIYYFQNVLLQDIASVVRRWYGVSLVFDNPAISGSHYTGALRKDRPLNEFLDNLSLTSGISYASKNGVVHLKAP